ncbi:MAG: chemotaxis protein CheW [Leptolyngbya sp. SIO3F4]|nr:chemotaxis protein CheW [Leptolyngbya sp. SIO3F4]
MVPTVSLRPSSPETISTPIDPLGLSPIPADTRQRFLRFKLLGKYDSLLPLQDITEVKTLAISDILPVPEQKNSVLGVCNWRGEILWLADLNALVGDRPLWHQIPLLEEPIAIVVESAQRSVGLVVEKVDDIELIVPESIQIQNDFCSPIQASYVAGYLPDHKGIILHTAAIVKHLLQGPP